MPILCRICSEGRSYLAEVGNFCLFPKVQDMTRWEAAGGWSLGVLV